jgi:eukaryotic-like serine/threonine-protein kinase
MTTLTDAALANLRRLDESPPPQTERYEILDELGRGGMGVVYRARDRQLEREVALKVGSDALSASSIQRLQREARVLATLEHPGIVPVHDVGTLDDGRIFYVMRRVRGDTLAERLQANIARGEALRTFIRICDTLAFAHAHGVIHRDLTPRNIMLGPFSEVMVLDWGVAKVRNMPRADGSAPSSRAAADGPTTMDGAVIGTPGYVAPEQMGAAADVDERADVYALGRILDELLRSGDDGSVPAPLRSIVARASAPMAGDRYPDADALARDVTAFLDGMSVSAHRESLAERLGRLARRHRLALSLLGMYVFVRLLLIVLQRR